MKDVPVLIGVCRRVISVVLILAFTSTTSYSQTVHVPGLTRADLAGSGIGVSNTQLLIEPQDGVGPLVRLLDAAQRTIFVEAYILSQHRFLRALQRAATQGVNVYVLLDPHPYGLGPQPQQAAAVLKAAGVSVRWTSPRYYFTHAKFCVLDDRVAVVSTANFSQAAFKSNRELLAIDRNRPDVHDLSNVFRSDWDRIPYSNHNRNLVISPNSRGPLEALLYRASKFIDVYAEEVADPRLDRLLERRASRVRVRVLVSATYRSRDLASFSRHHILVRRLRFPYVHAKAYLIDRRTGFIGSENLSPTSLDLNREVGLLVQGAAVQRAENTFDSDWKRGVRP